jgi:FkbM family methyltransferase
LSTGIISDNLEHIVKKFVESGRSFQKTGKILNLTPEDIHAKILKAIENKILPSGINSFTKSLHFDFENILIGSDLYEQIFLMNEYCCLPGFEIKKDDVIIDVGANIGLFSIFAASQCYDGTVYSFEPSKTNFKQFQKFIEINNISNIVSSNHAIFDNESSMKLYKPDDEGSYSLFEENAKLFDKGNGYTGNYEEVPTFTLSSIFNKYNITKCNYLKIDCEGCELCVLKSLSDEIFEKIDRIVLEWHPNVNIKDIENILQSKNFKTTKMFERYKHNDSKNYMGSLFAIKNDLL